jgi:hypothetical protein
MNSYHNHTRLTLTLLVACLLAVPAIAQNKNTDKPKPIQLLNGKDLSNFYTLIRNSDDRKQPGDLNQDPDKVYTYNDGILRVSGQHMGYMATKESYENYRLVAEFKWGDKTWDGQGRGRDAGLFFHGTGEDKLFMKSLECQLLEGGTGDICVISGASLTINGETKTKQCFDRPGKQPWENKLGFRGPDEIEKPLGQWNRIVLVCRGDTIKLTINGRLLHEGTKASPSSGKIYIQSNNAELFYRKLDLYPLPAPKK